jgi:pimeloyl-ACP methyl ester carboxylesterase
VASLHKEEVHVTHRHAGFATCVALAALWITSRLGAAAQPASHFLNCHGVKIHYVVQGTGEPVILIHGLYSSAGINWQLTGVFADLAKDHRVIALDLPGHGRSDKPESEAAYGLVIIDDIVALLDQLHVKQVHVVGYSLGGMIAVKLLALHPERVKSGFIGGMGWFRAGSPLQRFWEGIPNRDKQPVPSAFLQKVGQFAVTAEELKSIKVPVEVLVGSRDPVKPLYVAAVRRARPDWPVIEVDGAGHINCIVRPEFRNEIGAWVRKPGKP